MLVLLASLAVAAPPTLDEWSRLSQVGSVQLSPDGSDVLFVLHRWHDAPEDEVVRRSQLWVTPVDGLTEPRPFTAGHTSSSAPVYSPDGQWIYFLSDRGEGTQAWRIHRHGGEAQPLTEVEDGIGHLVLGNQGNTLYFTVSHEVREGRYAWIEEGETELSYNDVPAERAQAFSLDLTVPDAEPVAVSPEGMHCFELAASPVDGRLAALTSPDARLHSREGWSQVVVFGDGEPRTVTDTRWREEQPSPYGWLQGLSWSPDGQALVFGVDWDGYAGEAFTVRVSPEGVPGDPERVLRPAEGPHWWGTPRFTDPDTLMGTVSDHGRVVLARVEHPFAPEPGKRGCDTGAVCQTWTDLTPAPASVLSWDVQGDVAAMVQASPEHLARLFVGSPDAAAPKLRFDPNPQAGDWTLPVMETRTWKSTNGQEVEGILWRPADAEGPTPLLVNIHGGPTAARHEYLRGSPIDVVPVATGLGYAVFQPNYRGSTGYGDEFLEQLIGHKNDKDLIDIELGVLTLLQEGWVDEERVGIYGWSNGGSITNWAVQSSNLWKAGVSGAGVADPWMQWWLEDTPNHVVNFSEGYPWRNRAKMHQKSPVRRAERVDMPLMLIVGEDDPRVPAAHARAYHRTLGILGKDVELAVLPDAGHGPSGYEQRRAVGRLILAWFQKHLRGEDPEQVRASLHWDIASDDETAGDDAAE